MAKQWKSTAHKGLRYFEHDTRKHGKKFDRYYTIRFRLDGKLHTYGVGWLSDGIPAAIRVEEPNLGFEDYCLKLLREYKGNVKTGVGPISPKEKRDIEKEKRDQAEQERKQAEKENVTFGYYFENDYFPTHEIGRKKDTTRKTKEHFKKWIEPVIGNIPFKDIKPFNIEKIKKNILNAGRSPRTLEYVMATIRQVWNTARLNGQAVGDSPTKSIKKLKYDNKRVRFLTNEEAETLLNSLKERDALAYELALISLHCGLRFGEIAALKWGHINLDKAIIEIVDPKGIEGRAAFMTNKVKAMFDKMERKEPEDYVFTRNGEKLKGTPKIYSKVVTDLGLNNGITDKRRKVYFHSLRHTYASWHVEAGTDIYAVKELLGHSNISMTERYSHLAPEALKNATKNLEKSIRAGHKKDKSGQVVKFKK